jgi:hypothetical protein
VTLFFLFVPPSLSPGFSAAGLSAELLTDITTLGYREVEDVWCL